MPVKEMLDPKSIEWARKKWQAAMPVREMLWALDMSRATLYGYAKRHDFGPHPLAHHTRTYQPRATSRLLPPTTEGCQFACPCCGCKSLAAQGHDSCQAAA